MRPLPLQVIDEPQLPEWLLAFGQVASLLSGLIGVLIAYVAYRGYRRNDSRPMLYVAAGFGLALGIPFALYPFVRCFPRASHRDCSSSRCPVS
ncbi:DUF7521 family protein [Natranaeroarchaeum sulfidigenes]|uniref:DUF7521 family protein n=1 Tax=Natranaeroarchaeum sulfidigenes TaxID=2784880 RepID=UPI004046D6A4